MSSRSSLSTWNRRLLRRSRGSASRPHRHVSARPPPAAAEATRALQHLEASPPRVATLVALAQNLLRSESVASSRIEVVHLSHKRLARAAYQADEGQWDRRAAEVLGNVEAMKRAIELGTAGSPLTVADIEDIHRTLLRITEDTEIAGVVRTTQNWIGGNDYNPVGASYVPPRPEHVPLLEDLCAFVNRVDLAPIVQAGIAHAQFETIHPFADGNGRVGRALIYTVLRRRGEIPRYIPPISLILAAQPQSYIAGWRVTGRVRSAHGSPSSPMRPRGRQQKPSDSPTRSSSSDQPGSTISAGHVAMPRFGSS